MNAHPLRRTAANMLLSAGLALLALPGLASAAHAAPISSATGPLTKIAISTTLNCSVDHLGDYHGEWFEEIACGTFVAVGDHIYGPQSIPAGEDLTSTAGYLAFTPVSQSPVTGSGTAASPFTVTTVVSLGETGLTLTEVDTYVVGQESYRTEIKLSQTGGEARSVRVYRGGDCYLQNSDFGRGAVLNGNAPTCRAPAKSADPNRVLGFQPVTGGSTYIEGDYDAVWKAIGTRAALPNTIGDEWHDNGVAVSWSVDIPASGSSRVSSLAFFSPVGHAPVTLTKTASVASAPAGNEVTYTITATNPGVLAETLTAIVDDLPAGFSYVPGSTTGLTTSDPTVSGQRLTWAGTFALPAATSEGPGVKTLSFKAKTSATVGVFTNSVDAQCEQCTVVGAESTAPVTVTQSTTPPPGTEPTTPPPAPKPVPEPRGKSATTGLDGDGFDPSGLLLLGAAGSVCLVLVPRRRHG